MTFIITYLIEFDRVIPACEIDNRVNNPAILNKLGTVIDSFNDAQVATITANVLPYKIETNNGNLVGYFTLAVADRTATVVRIVLRTAFSQFSSVISTQINNFINNGTWLFDSF